MQLYINREFDTLFDEADRCDMKAYINIQPTKTPHMI